MVEQRGIAMLPELMQQVAAGFAARGLAAPVWSIADEPGNPGSMPADLERLRGAIRLGDPKARVAGELNRPADRQLLGLFDVVLLNAGFGIDAQEIQRWRKTGPTPWLYNMPDVEAAAGFHLWRTGAAGYLQWHGRAIRADPFDPTDSGEADVQLYPMQPEICAGCPTSTCGCCRSAAASPTCAGCSGWKPLPRGMPARAPCSPNCGRRSRRAGGAGTAGAGPAGLAATTGRAGPAPESPVTGAR